MAETCAHGNHATDGPLRDGLCKTHWWRKYLERDMDAPMPAERKAQQLETARAIAEEYLRLAAEPRPGAPRLTLSALALKHGLALGGKAHRMAGRLIREMAGGKRPKAKRTCSVEGCGRTHQSRGLCQSHNLHMKKYGAVRPIQPRRAHRPDRKRHASIVDKRAAHG